MHWVHENYWQPGPQGNDIQKTNVPNLRMRFRFDNHQEEVCCSLVSCSTMYKALKEHHLKLSPVASSVLGREQRSEARYRLMRLL